MSRTDYITAVELFTVEKLDPHRNPWAALHRAEPLLARQPMWCCTGGSGMYTLAIIAHMGPDCTCRHSLQAVVQPSLVPESHESPQIK